MDKKQLDLKALRELHQRGQLEAAKKGYSDFLRKNPNNAEALHALAIICVEQKNLAEAVDYLRSAIQYQPNHPTLQLHLANVLKMQGLFSQAADVLIKTVSQHPNYAPAFNNLGIMYYAQGKLSDAIHFYKLAIEKEPQYVDARYNLGLALSKNNEFDDAIKVYEKLLEQDPEHVAARFHLACALMQEEKLNLAINHFQYIEKNYPHHLETQINLAACHLKQGALQDAKVHYLNALQLAPKDTQVLFNLGCIDTQLGHIDDAVQYYKNIVEINPDNFAAHYNLGVIFFTRKQANVALPHLQKALRLQPKNTAIEHLIKIIKQDQDLATSPTDYIKSLFDYYADHYEPHLLTVLDYQVPKILHQSITKIIQPTDKKFDILDLGCGTGLCGLIFKPLAEHLVGIDLSTKMLKIAAEKNIYDELIADDFVSFLSKQNNSFDIILAGDVLVYIGDLTSLYKSIKQALRKDGLFAFNAEISEKADYAINPSGRFSHKKSYLDDLAKKNNLKPEHYQSAITRIQNNEPVYGHIYVLQKISL